MHSTEAGRCHTPKVSRPTFPTPFGSAPTPGRRDRLNENYRITQSGPPDPLVDDADHQAAGLSSLATLHLMLAIEEEFDIEIPDRMPTRTLFSSMDSLAAAVSESQQAIAAAWGDTKARVARGLAESAP
jgi:acyl carrier protein